MKPIDGLKLGFFNVMAKKGANEKLAFYDLAAEIGGWLESKCYIYFGCDGDCVNCKIEYPNDIVMNGFILQTLGLIE